MKAVNRYGYHCESIFGINQWLDADDFDINDVSYFPLKESIVVQFFNKGKYAGCVVTTDITNEVRLLHIRIINSGLIKSIPLSKFKQRNNGKLYNETIN